MDPPGQGVGGVVQGNLNSWKGLWTSGEAGLRVSNNVSRRAQTTGILLNTTSGNKTEKAN